MIVRIHDKEILKELAETKTNYSILEKKYQDLCNDWFALQAELIQNKANVSDSTPKKDEED